MSRLIATLTIVGVFVVGVAALVILTAPAIVDELAYFIDNFPLYIKQVQGLASDPNRPWLSKLVGEGLAYAGQSVGELTTLATSWFSDFLRSVWTGGQALISAFSLLVVTPIVACYLIYNWKEMMAAIDNWIPPAQRDNVRSLAREIDDTIGGFVIGQGTLCLILAVFYAATLSLLGLRHGLLIGVAAGLISFVPYLGSLTWPRHIDVRCRRTVLAALGRHLDRPGDLLRRPNAVRLCAVALFRRTARQLEPGLDHVCAVRVRLPVRIRRPFDRRAACGRYRRADALRVATILRKLPLYGHPEGICGRCG